MVSSKPIMTKGSPAARAFVAKRVAATLVVVLVAALGITFVPNRADTITPRANAELRPALAEPLRLRIAPVVEPAQAAAPAPVEAPAAPVVEQPQAPAPVDTSAQVQQPAPVVEAPAAPVVEVPAAPADQPTYHPPTGPESRPDGSVAFPGYGTLPDGSNWEANANRSNNLDRAAAEIDAYRQQQEARAAVEQAYQDAGLTIGNAPHPGRSRGSTPHDPNTKTKP